MSAIIERVIVCALAALAAVTVVEAGQTTNATPAATPATGPGGAPFDLEQWLGRREPAYMVPLTVSADGKWLAVTMCGLVREGATNAVSQPKEAGMFEAASEDLAGSEVFIVERETGQVTRPFHLFAASYSPVWSPSGRKLALAIQDSPTRLPRIAIWSPDDATPRIFVEAPFRPAIGFTAPTWTPDGNRLVFPLFNVPRTKTPRLKQTILGKTEDAKNSEPPVSKETLAVLDVAEGAVRPFKGFGPYEYSEVWGFRLSSDGKRAAFLARAAPLKQEAEANWVRLTIVELVSGAVQTIGTTQTDGWGMGLSWSPDGRHIAWQPTVGPQEKLLIATLGDGAVLREVVLPKEVKDSHLQSAEDWPPALPLWTADSSGFWITGKNALLHFAVDGSRLGDLALPAGMGGIDWLENAAPTFAPVRTQVAPASGNLFLARNREIERVNLQTTPLPKAESIPGSAGKERAVDWKTSTLFTLRGTGTRGWEVMQTSLADGKSSRLALLYPGFAKIDYGQTRTLAWALADGTKCRGTLLLPVGWQEGDKPPVVMDVYGGDKGKGNKSSEAMNDESNIMNPHLLSTRGYAFFKPDMPQTKAEPAASLVRSADAAAEALHASGLVNADRIGIMGQSYGGYTVLCVLTGSDRFKAGIVANGTYDLTRAETDDMSHSSAWVEDGQGLMGASLWEKTQRYIDNSPLFALHKLQTPLLVLQGGADSISRNQGPALLAALQRLGKPAEYLFGNDMDHVPTSWSIETQRELIPHLLAFFDNHLKPKP